MYQSGQLVSQPAIQDLHDPGTGAFLWYVSVTKSHSQCCLNVGIIINVITENGTQKLRELGKQ